MNIPWHQLRPLWRGLYWLALLMFGASLFATAWVGNWLAAAIYMLLFLLVVGYGDRYGLPGERGTYFLMPASIYLLFAIVRMVWSPIWFFIVVAARWLLVLIDLGLDGLRRAMWRRSVRRAVAASSNVVDLPRR